MRILVLNAGSSSLKTSLVQGGRAIEQRSARWSSEPAEKAHREETLTGILTELNLRGANRPGAVGHRIVHGGSEFRSAVEVDEDVVTRLRATETLAPLHNPVGIDTLEQARRTLPDVPQVVAFDTSFHASMPEVAWRYPVPDQWTQWGVRRYGFHGLSVEWSVARAAELLRRQAAALRLVVAHLGGGCSVTAVAGGRSVATSMGMTPLEGLMMGTRAGSIDPGIMIRLLRDGRRTPAGLEEDLEHRSGLVALTGTSDMIAIQAAADEGDERATLALDMFCDRAAAAVAAAATSLRSLDVLVFTGGIGEHAPKIRRRIVERLAVLGIDASLDEVPTDDDVILSAPQAPIAVLRIVAREDLVIARQTEELIGR